MNKLLLLTNLFILLFCGSAKSENWLEYIKKNPPTADSGDYSSGTNFENYQAKNARGLAYLIYLVNERGYDFSGNTVAILEGCDLSGREWVPIGTYENPFRGSISGNQKYITGLTINRDFASESGVAGLFGYVEQTDKEIKVEYVFLSNSGASGINISSEVGCYAGSFIGHLKICSNNKLMIKGCVNSNPVSVTSGSSDPDHLSVAGGLIGIIESDEERVSVNLSGDSKNEGVIKAVAEEAACAVSGGLFGMFKTTGSVDLAIENGHCYGEISASSNEGNAYAGGYVGWILSSGGIIKLGEAKVYDITIKAASASGISAAAGVIARADVEGTSTSQTKPIYNGSQIIEGDITSQNIGIDNGFNTNGSTANYGEVIDLDNVMADASKGITVYLKSSNVINVRLEGYISEKANKSNRYTLRKGNNNKLNYSGGGSSANINTVNVEIDPGNYVMFDSMNVAKLIVNEGVKMIAMKSKHIITSSVELHDGLVFPECGIDNKGDITYYRKPSYFSTGDSDGWETICLPFDATISVEDRPLKYFGEKTQAEGDFWLKTLSTVSTETAVGFAFIGGSGVTIPANQPCILSFPGDSEEWDSECSLEGKTIRYHGTGEVKGNHSNFLDVAQVTNNFHFKVSGWNSKFHEEVYMLDSDSEVEGAFSEYNNEGRTFYLSSKQMNPLRCYIKSFQANKSPVLRIASGSTPATGLETMLMKKGGSVYVRDGVIYYLSDIDTKVPVYDCYGRMVGIFAVHAGENEIEGLAPGIYIIGKKKVMI